MQVPQVHTQPHLINNRQILVTGTTVTVGNKSIIMYLGGEAACFREMINNLFFLQAVGVDGVSAVCPIEINHFIPYKARL